MEEIEVNEYIRTNTGYIAKLEQYLSNIGTYLFDDFIQEIQGDKYRCISENELEKVRVKYSKQLIDLIEVGDIVEIELSEEFVEKKDKNKLIQIGDIYTKETLQKDIDNGIITRILTILSYNQYMANCYKVGGEDE